MEKYAKILQQLKKLTVKGVLGLLAGVWGAVSLVIFLSVFVVGPIYLAIQVIIGNEPLTLWSFLVMVYVFVGPIVAVVIYITERVERGPKPKQVVEKTYIKECKSLDDELKLIQSFVGIFRPNPEEFFLEPTQDLYKKLSGSLEEIQEVAHAIASHIGLSVVPLVQWRHAVTRKPDFVAGPNGVSTPTTYREVHGTFEGAIITLSDKYMGNPTRLGAVLAHELTHCFLSRKGIGPFPPFSLSERENERLTDLTSIFLGLGKLVLNGYEPFSLAIRPEEAAAFFMKVNQLRGINRRTWVANLESHAIEFIKSIEVSEAKWEGS